MICDPSENLGLAEAMQRLTQLDWRGLEKFELVPFLSRTPLNCLRKTCDMIVTATWPALTMLHLSHHGLEDSHILLLTAGAWPLLQSVGLAGSGITVHGIEQLVNGNWPLMTRVCSRALQEGIRPPALVYEVALAEGCCPLARFF